MTAPATPAPAGGAPGERVSVSAEALDRLRELALAYASIPAGADDLDAGCDLASAVASLGDTAAPLPAPSASAGVGAETISDEVHDAIAMLMTDCYRDGAAGVETAVAEHSRRRLIAAHLDALSTAAAPVRPDRAAFIAALGTLTRAAVADHESDYHGYPSGGDGLGAAYNALLALVFGDSAPGERTDVAAAPVRPDREAVRSAIEAYANTYCYAVSTERRVENGHADPADADDAFICASALLQEALALVFGDSAPGEVAS